MPIDEGICHDFAFSRCYESLKWTTTLSALTDLNLWDKIEEGQM